MAAGSRDIAAAIRAEMGRQRMTMLALAGLTGIPRTTLAEQVNGAGRITAANLVLIAEALNVHPSTFIDGAAV